MRTPLLKGFEGVVWANIFEDRATDESLAKKSADLKVATAKASSLLNSRAGVEKAQGRQDAGVTK